MSKYLSLIIIVSLIIVSCSNAETKNSNYNNSTIEDTSKLETITKQRIEIDKKYLLGKFNPEQDSIYVKVPAQYCLIRAEYVHKDVLNDYIKMYDAASEDGVNLGIISAHRTFDVQKWLWDQKFYNSNNPTSVCQGILRYLAMPGTSRHHWGTDIDMLSTKLYYFETEIGIKSYQWLLDNASNYGFYQVYTPDRETGYNEEKWHWTYLPVSKEFQKQYLEKITYNELSGFNGSETAKDLNVIEDYVFGINKELLK